MLNKAVSRHLGFALLLIGLLSACSGLAGEPQIIATLPPATSAPQQVSFPAAAPDLALGAQIYAERCVRCHGASGRGDGVLIGTGQDQIPNVPRDFTDPATTRDQTPLDWYNTITNGRIQNLMPPWNEALTDEERWAVALYTYTMSYTPDLIAAGQQLWTTGAGAGGDLPAQSELAQLTDEALLQQAAEAAGASQYISALDNEQRRAVAAFLRSGALDSVEVIGQPAEKIAQAVTPVPPATTPETTAEGATSTTGAITGSVTNGTAGGTVPPGLIVTLRELDADFNEVSRNVAINSDGSFRFDDVNIRADYSYVVTTVYQDRIFGSNVVTGDPTAPTLELPVTIYDITGDPSVMYITGLVTQVVAAEGVVQVAQVFSFTNTSDRVFSTDQFFAENQYGSLTVSIPPGAQLRGFADTQQRYMIGDDGLTVTDTAPVLPGEGHILHVLYELPYTGDLQIEQPMNYAIEGPVRLLITPDSVTATSDQLPPLGPQTLRSVTYQGYGATFSRPAGETLRFRLSGQPTASSAGDSAGIVPVNTLVPVLLVGGGALIIIAGLVIYLRGRAPALAASAAPSPTDSQTLIDGLIRQIAELDDAHAAGEIDEATYHKRRKRLKTRLSELMDEDA
ncbi:MAG: c-type cytochrome [Chloroflexi bacterium]|nr:c-type cytochrome [Chloroflexota bacterium]